MALLDKLRGFRSESKKHVFITRDELSLIASKLQPQGTGAQRRGAARRRGQGVVSAEACGAHLTAEYISTNFRLVGSGDQARVCRLVKRGGKVFTCPVVALEDLESLFRTHHQALGHPGFETLFLHVSRQRVPSCSGGWRWKKGAKWVAGAVAHLQTRCCRLLQLVHSSP